MRYEISKTCRSELSGSFSVTMIASDHNGRDIRLKPTTHANQYEAHKFIERYAQVLATQQGQFVIAFLDASPYLSGYFSGYSPREYSLERVRSIADGWQGCAAVVYQPMTAGVVS